MLTYSALTSEMSSATAIQVLSQLIVQFETITELFEDIDRLEQLINEALQE